ncbi:MAG: c-type cytochrome [Armatimonadota bacterium]
MRLAPLLIMLGFAASAGVQDWSCAPRMKRQPSMRPFEQPMPEGPTQSIPRGGAAIPTAEEAAALRSPIAPSQRALARGRLYYGYYCQACHGEDGRGHAPVGESYYPAPTDLSRAEVQSKSDGELYRAMVVGTGHEPTLAYIVPPERRWLIVLHVRELALPEERVP